jgi:PAS domain S-box-containing protein
VAHADHKEEELLRSVAQQNAKSILLARRRAEEELQRQSEWLRVTLASIGDAVVTTDSAGRISSLNRVAMSLTGWSQAEAAGRQLPEVFRIIDEVTRRPFDDPVKEALGQAATTAVARQAILIAKDGSERLIEDSAAPIRDADGAILGVVLVFRDVTERRVSERLRDESEQRFRSLVVATSQVVWTTDPTGQVVDDSPSWREFTGQTQEQRKGWGWLDAIHPDDRERTTQLWRRSVTDNSIYQTEYRLRTADGTYRWTAVRAVPVLNRDGTVREWVGMNTDITDSKHAEEALREADRRKDEFLSMLAHELRNPLSAILNAGQILNRIGSNDPQAAQLRAMIHRQCQNITRMVDDLLDVSRIARGKIQLKKEVLDLSTIIGRAVESVRPYVEHRQHELVVSLGSQPMRLAADPTRLEQILANLLNNAVKYTEPGGHIRLLAEREEDEIVIRVEDNGIGIATDMLPHVFDLFTQADNSLAKSEGGLGIGLALVRNLVELHGGIVTVHSAGPGKGSQFVVRLPGLPEEVRPAAPQDESMDVASQRLRVLVVDDSVDVAECLCMVLNALGHDSAMVHSGAAALDSVRRQRPDVILIDIGMPEMNGHELARRLRSQPDSEALCLVALTGYGREEDRRAAKQAGFDSHLVKPVGVATLETLLASVADRSGNPRGVSAASR